MDIVHCLVFFLVKNMTFPKLFTHDQVKDYLFLTTINKNETYHLLGYVVC
jgi:hypothetical protein